MHDFRLLTQLFTQRQRGEGEGEGQESTKSAPRTTSADNNLAGNLHQTQSTILGWLGRVNNMTTESQIDSSERPPHTSHGVDTFASSSNTAIFPSATNNTGNQGFGNAQQIPDQPPRRSSHKTPNRQSCDFVPTTSEFTFSISEPPFPTLSYPPSLGTSAREVAAGREELLSQLNLRRTGDSAQSHVAPHSHTEGPVKGSFSTASTVASGHSRAMDPDLRDHNHRRDSSIIPAESDLRNPSGHSNPRDPLNLTGDTRLQSPIPIGSATPSHQSVPPNPWFSGPPASALFGVGTSVGAQTPALNLAHSTATHLPERHRTTEKPMRCLVCGDNHVKNLVQACTQCENFYCFDCIKAMFEAALESMASMPARCCTIVQLSVALPHIPKEMADLYRARFEEWMSTTITYCPKPTCSVFIPERFLIPPSKPVPTVWELLKPQLRLVVQALSESEDSKYFRSTRSPKQLEIDSFYRLVRKPIFLETIERRLRSYTELGHFMGDINLLFSNARRFERTEYSEIGAAGTRLQILFYKELNDLKIELQPRDAQLLPNNACFACPKCFTGICSECKQIAHPLKPCDTSFRDREAALLATFGYKRCPKCGHAVEKMYRCPHVQCQCGAHWCYRCKRPIQRCNLEGCDEPDGSDDDDGDDDSVHEVGENSNAVESRAARPSEATLLLSRAEDGARERAGELPVGMSSDAQGPVERNDVNDTDNGRSDSRINTAGDQTRSAQAMNNNAVDLDAGGQERWESAGDFGDELDEPLDAETAWSCEHHFCLHEIKASRVNNGYPLQLECNRCFSEIHAMREDGETRKKTERIRNKDEEKPAAFECIFCSLIFCKQCKAHYIADKGATEHEE